jgi:hypothetical protein
VPPLFRNPPTLGNALLRKALMHLDAGERRCTECERTPLIGERVHLYEDGRVACDLCRVRHQEEPIRSEKVHGSERGHAVRPAVRVAA